MLIEYEKHFFIMQYLYDYTKTIKKKEVPISSFIILKNKIISKSNNRMIKYSNPNAHAEIISLKKATYNLKSHFLYGATIYITQEPCIMCIESIINHKIKKIIFASESSNTKKWDFFKYLIRKKKLDLVINIKDKKFKKILKNFFFSNRRLR